eukprot:TRINITY_DN1683_c1_g1_i13.p1 TRINITY_DN1683_c1_g1~~TRINITY_DN1683_c1_g1_i13.p1  ORF type:complete len:476 (+),score=29.58 TRINITY_DN1683_c1_g1_i13:45-1472(+)
MKAVLSGLCMMVASVVGQGPGPGPGGPGGPATGPVNAACQTNPCGPKQKCRDKGGSPDEYWCICGRQGPSNEGYYTDMVLNGPVPTCDFDECAACIDKRPERFDKKTISAALVSYRTLTTNSQPCRSQCQAEDVCRAYTHDGQTKECKLYDVYPEDADLQSAPEKMKMGRIGVFGTCALLPNGESVCPSDEGQTCEDPDWGEVQDWMCVCPNGDSEQLAAVRGACGASNSSDECELYGDTCTMNGQECFDPFQGTPDDWLCLCAGEKKGAAVASPVLLDECEVLLEDIEQDECEQCASEVTATDGVIWGGVDSADLATLTEDECSQECLNDEDCHFYNFASQLEAALDDSRCVRGASCCQMFDAGATSGSPVDGWTSGKKDKVLCATCSDANQTCMDFDPFEALTWQCSCVSPLTGSAQLEPATCIGPTTAPGTPAPGTAAPPTVAPATPAPPTTAHPQPWLPRLRRRRHAPRKR